MSTVYTQHGVPLSDAVHGIVRSMTMSGLLLTPPQLVVVQKEKEGQSPLYPLCVSTRTEERNRAVPHIGSVGSVGSVGSGSAPVSSMWLPRLGAIGSRWEQDGLIWFCPPLC